MRALVRSLGLLFLAFCFSGAVPAQSGRTFPRAGESSGKRNTPPAATPAPTPDIDRPAPDIERTDEDDVLRVETELVTVPVIVRDRSDRYIPDMQQHEFTLEEDGQPQEIAFFSKTDAPFHVVLLLDTSASTQDKLRAIQNAAVSFAAQLQTADRVQVISFDDQVRVQCEFTSERAELQRAIYRTRPGQGTKLYDAMHRAIASLSRIKGRKAIVIFTDGVDSYSDKQSYDKNIKLLEEAGIIVYPIRFDTRADIEALMRQQRQNGGLIDLGTILGGRTGGTPTTVPGGTTPAPRKPQPSSTGIPRLPGVVIGGRRNDPNDPNDPRNPNPNDPNRRNDGLSDLERAELDRLYQTADAYLRDLANTTGGSLYRADYLGQLPAAFDRIAAELRTQYALGYYPTNRARDGKLRKIKVKSTRKNVAVRARPNYRK